MTLAGAVLTRRDRTKSFITWARVNRARLVLPPAGSLPHGWAASDMPRTFDPARPTPTGNASAPLAVNIMACPP